MWDFTAVKGYVFYAPVQHRSPAGGQNHTVNFYKHRAEK